MSEKIKLPIIVGATASGKSALAMRIAEEIGGEIVSCDSMQIYRRMNIGTAKPTAEEQSRVRHHLIDVIEPWETFSCADYARLADEAIRDVIARGKTPIVCGGTGLYLDALLRGGLAEEADCDENYRNELNALAEEKGNDYVHGLLRDLDPESADAIHPNNRKRVIRALEICRVTGRKKSEIDRENSAFDGAYEPLAVGLFYTDRAVLYDRIDRRVDQMLREGLLDEVRALDAEGIFERSRTAAGAIGYKELLGFIRGEMTLAEASDTLKMATRRYAKRQCTWFGAKTYVERIDVDGVPDEKTLEKISEKTKKVFQLS
ncbi:MAG: tRNA (adenosine(37)-N6)-dimethylallyltransferase MiaA [Clostridia bacterium]|nr:tRNA (adenosine(37)-N6)-dimethylallyltransferase MiaA [Clostridia bacterium]